MRLVSTDVERMVPQQERASRRVQQFLDVAEAIFAEVGYEATTMTAIAERSGTSIGALYRYFPDKEAVAHALHRRYSLPHWSEGYEDLECSTSEFASQLVDRMMAFVAERPAYLPLVAAPIKFKKDPESRRNLRLQFSRAFSARCPGLSEERALLIANVTIQIMGGLIRVYAESAPEMRADLLAEFKKVLGNYLLEALAVG
jgi:AcrR family transcriptional regulator